MTTYRDLYVFLSVNTPNVPLNVTPNVRLYLMYRLMETMRDTNTTHYRDILKDALLLAMEDYYQ